MNHSIETIYSSDNSDDISGLMLKAIYHCKHKNYDFARYYLEETLKIDPNHFWALQELANIFAGEKKFLRAAEYYKKARIAAGLSEDLKVYAGCSLADTLLAMGDNESAEKIYLECIDHYPSYVFSYTGLAALYEQTGPAGLEKVVELYERANLIDPDHLWIRENLKKSQAKASEYNAIQTRTGKLEKTVEPTIFSLCIAGDWEALFERECAFQKSNKTFRQKTVLSQLKSLPKDAFADLGVFYQYIAKELIRGVNFEAALAMNTDLELSAKFFCLALSNILDANAETYRKAVEVFLAINDLDNAERISLEAVSIFPDHPGLLLLTARVMTKLNFFGEARLFFGEYIRSESGIAEEDILEEIIEVHEKANQTNAKKYASLQEFFKNFRSVKFTFSAKIDAAIMKQTDSWLTEFFSLLGDFPIDSLIDIEHYRKQRKKWIAKVEDAVTDYFMEGWQLRVSLHPAIDNDYLRRQLVNQGKMSADPLLLLYLRNEVALKLVPNAMIEPGLLHEQGNTQPGSPWLKLVRGDVKPAGAVSPFFDTAYYLERTSYKDDETSQSPIVNFLSKDFLADCNYLFHTGYYINRYENMLNGKSPILHYLAEGAYLGYMPNPFCNLSGKSGQERIDYLKLS